MALTVTDREWAEAVQDDHYCDNNACDIAAALRAGYPRVAAYLLDGATEARAVFTLMVRAGENWHGFGHRDADDSDWERWVDWFYANTTACDCGAYNFTDRGTVYSCANCGARFPTEDDS